MPHCCWLCGQWREYRAGLNLFDNDNYQHTGTQHYLFKLVQLTSGGWVQPNKHFTTGVHALSHLGLMECSMSGTNHPGVPPMPLNGRSEILYCATITKYMSRRPFRRVCVLFEYMQRIQLR